MAANPLRRWWSYLKAKMNSSLDERADPKVQLEQAISEAQDQHRRLKEQAANVIANQKQTEMQLNRAMSQLESTNGKAHQAVIMADDAQKRGDAVKATEYTKAAESFAGQLIQTERQVESLKQLSLQSTQAADQAKAAVQQNSSLLQQKLAERQKLLSQLDQAKMQEQMNRAMSSLSEAVGQDVPTLEEVRDKIEARYARALGSAEIQGQTVESRMLEVEQASMDVEAQARLEQIKAQLGLGPGATPPSVGAGDQATVAQMPDGATHTQTPAPQTPEAAPATSPPDGSS
jgi:phage shock protein A